MVIKEAVGTADTLDAAKENAISQLNAKIDDDVQIEIIEMPKKKVLGIFGGQQAKVRAYIEGPDPKPAKKTGKKLEKKANKPQKEVKEAKAEKKEVKAEELNFVDAALVDANAPAGRAFKYVADVLKELGCEEISAKIADVEGGAKILLEGEKLGVIIGRRGETLDAIQYLASLIANEKGGGYYRIVLDIGNYRAKREQTLINLANKTAEQVLRTGRNRSLEPMNPYERRIIHTAIQEIQGVTSMSIGDGAGRRVVISPEGKQAPRRNGGNNRRNAPRKAQTNNTANVETVNKVDVADVPLYGKIVK